MSLLSLPLFKNDILLDDSCIKTFLTSLFIVTKIFIWFPVSDFLQSFFVLDEIVLKVAPALAHWMSVEVPPGSVKDWAPAAGAVHDVHGHRDDTQGDAEQSEQVQVEDVPHKHLLPPGQAVREVPPVNVVIWIKVCVGVRVAFGHHRQQDDGVDDQVEVGGDEENQLGALRVVEVGDGQPSWHHGLDHLVSVRFLFSQIKEAKENKEQDK